MSGPTVLLICDECGGQMYARNGDSPRPADVDPSIPRQGAGGLCRRCYARRPPKPVDMDAHIVALREQVGRFNARCRRARADQVARQVAAYARARGGR